MPPSKRKIIGKARSEEIVPERTGPAPLPVKLLTKCLQPAAAAAVAARTSNRDEELASILQTAVHQTVPPSKTRRRMEFSLQTLSNGRSPANKTKRTVNDIAYLIYDTFQTRPLTSKRLPKNSASKNHKAAAKADFDKAGSVLPIEIVKKQLFIKSQLTDGTKSMQPLKPVCFHAQSVLESLMTLSEFPDEMSQRGAVVSDDSEAGVESDKCVNDDSDLDEQAVETEMEEVSVHETWGRLLEAVQLEVTARTGGGRKQYHMYRMNAPFCLKVCANVDDLRKRIEDKFLALYEGRVSSARGRRSQVLSACRVYSSQQPNGESEDLWLQINVGRPAAAEDEWARSASGKKLRQGQIFFVAVVRPGSPLVALASAGVGSRKQLIPLVLSALESALTSTDGYSSMQTTESSHQPVADLSGSDPRYLLESAMHLDIGKAAGRFAYAAETGAALNPISDMETAATDLPTHHSAGNDQSLSSSRRRTTWSSVTVIATPASKSRSKGQDSLAVVTPESTDNIVRHVAGYNRSVSYLEERIHTESNGVSALFAAKQGAIAIDHNAGVLRKRKRDAEDAFGRPEDCPKRESIRWNWKGKSGAAAMCWHGDANHLKTSNDVPKHKFKCRLELKGPDVIGGMRAWIEAGIISGPLPSYVQDVPSLGASINVVNGAVECTKNCEN